MCGMNLPSFAANAAKIRLGWRLFSLLPFPSFVISSSWKKTGNRATDLGVLVNPDTQKLCTRRKKEVSGTMFIQEA